MEQIYERHLREMNPERSLMRNIGMGTSSCGRIPPSESILQQLDEQLKRLEAAVLSLDERLKPLDCTLPQPESAAASPKVEPGYDTSSRFMNALEDRAHQIGRLADRLSQIDARTEL